MKQKIVFLVCLTFPILGSTQEICLRADLGDVYGNGRFTISDFVQFESGGKTMGYFNIHGIASCCHPNNTKPPFPMSGSGIWKDDMVTLNLFYQGTTNLNGQGPYTKFMAQKWEIPLPAIPGTSTIWTEIGFYMQDGSDIAPNWQIPTISAMDYRWPGSVIDCNDVKF